MGRYAVPAGIARAATHPGERHRDRAPTGAPGRWRLPGRRRLHNASRFQDAAAIWPTPDLWTVPMTLRRPPLDLVPVAAYGCELVTMATMVAVGPGQPARGFQAVAWP